jgi:hypothetical protein
VSVSDAWSIDLIRAALRARTLPEGSTALLLARVLGAGGQQVQAVLTDTRVPGQIRARLAMTALNSGTLRPRELGPLLDQDFTFRVHALPGLADAGQLRQALSALPPRSAAATLRQGPQLPARSVYPTLRHVAFQIPPSEAVRLIRDLTPAASEDQAHARSWVSLEDEVLLRAVHDELAQPGVALAPQQLAGLCSASALGVAWQDLLRACHAAATRGSAESRARLQRTLHSSEFLAAPRFSPPIPAVDQLALEYAVQSALAGATGGRDAAYLLGTLVPSLNDTVLTWAIRAVWRMPYGAAVSLAREVLLLVAKCGRDRSIWEAAATLGGYLNGDDWETLRARAAADELPADAKRRLAEVRRQCQRRPARRFSLPRKN